MEFTFSTARLLIQTEFAPIVSVFILVAFIKTNISFSDKINRYFLITCAALLLLSASDSMRFITANMTSPTFYRYLSAGGGYALRPLILYFITIIAGRNERKQTILFCVPLVFCALISIASIFPWGKGIMFSFSPDNRFIRGPLGFLSHIVCFFYAVLLIIYSINNCNNSKNEPLVILIMEIAACTAMMMENRYKYDFILSQIFITSIIFYFFFLLTQAYKRDTLTGFLSRRCFHLEINHLLKNSMILLSMDLNNLKKINDTNGHAAGDKALITVSETMRKNFARYAKLYRTGGDEFMAVFKKTKLENVKKLVEKFQEDIAKTDYGVACGIAEYKPGDDIDKVFALCDVRMYSDKERIKSKR